MTKRAFRFGVIGMPQGGAQRWRELALRVEELGYSTLLMPDVLQALSPIPALAVAAGATTRLRVGPYVLASPVRPPRSAAWDGHSMTVLTDGRFEFGIGSGRPDMIEQAVTLFGLPTTNGAQRLEQIELAIDHLRELDGEAHTPVLLAASGQKALTLAARKADIVSLAISALIPRDEAERIATTTLDKAREFGRDIELSAGIFAVGDEVPEEMAKFIGADGPTLIKHNSLAMVRGSAQEMADELQRRRDTFGISYVTVNSAFVEEFAPVVELLNGR